MRSCQGITTHTNYRKNLSGERKREREKGGSWIARDIAVIYGVTIPYGGTPLTQITPLAHHCAVTILREGYFVGLCRPRPPSPNMGKCRFDVGSRRNNNFQICPDPQVTSPRSRCTLQCRATLITFQHERVNNHVGLVTRVLRYFYLN